MMVFLELKLKAFKVNKQYILQRHTFERRLVLEIERFNEEKTAHQIQYVIKKS